MSSTIFASAYFTQHGSALVERQQAPLHLPPSLLLLRVHWQIADRLQSRTLTTTVSSCSDSALGVSMGAILFQIVGSIYPLCFHRYYIIADNVNIRPIFIIFHWKIHYSWLFWVNRGDNSIFLHCLTSVYSGLSFTRWGAVLQYTLRDHTTTTKNNYLQLLTSVLVLWVDGDTFSLLWMAEMVMTKMWCCWW